MSDPRNLRKRLAHARPAPASCGEPGLPDIEELRRKMGLLREMHRPKIKEVRYRRDLPRHSAPPTPARHLRGEPLRLEEAAPGVEAAAPTGGAAYLVKGAIDGLPELGGADEARRLCRRLAETLDGRGLAEPLARQCSLEGVRPEEVVFLDLETTGLGPSALFLVGSMVFKDGRLVLRQYLARDYAEEAAAISLFLADAAERPVLVTFNGKSFDLPQLRMRAAATGVPFDYAPAHLDLLHACRRVWKKVLPDCKLQTLESRVCGRARHGDIPGCEIPEAYHAFVRTSDAAEIAEILKHNALDLVTLADLMGRLPR